MNCYICGKIYFKKCKPMWGNVSILTIWGGVQVCLLVFHLFLIFYKLENSFQRYIARRLLILPMFFNVREQEFPRLMMGNQSACNSSISLVVWEELLTVKKSGDGPPWPGRHSVHIKSKGILVKWYYTLY